MRMPKFIFILETGMLNPNPSSRMCNSFSFLSVCDRKYRFSDRWEILGFQIGKSQLERPKGAWRFTLIDPQRLQQLESSQKFKPRGPLNFWCWIFIGCHTWIEFKYQLQIVISKLSCTAKKLFTQKLICFNIIFGL